MAETLGINRSGVMKYTVTTVRATVLIIRSCRIGGQLKYVKNSCCRPLKLQHRVLSRMAGFDGWNKKELALSGLRRDVRLCIPGQ